MKIITLLVSLLVSFSSFAGISVSPPISAASIAAAGGVTNGSLNQHILFVSTNGNDATAIRGDYAHPWQTIYDYTNSTKVGALAQATNGDTVVLLSDYTTVRPPVLPFFDNNITFDGQGHTVVRGANFGGSAWTNATFGTGYNAYQMLPMVIPTNGLTIKNVTLMCDFGATNPLSSESIFAQAFYNGGAGTYQGTNIDQVLQDVADNGVIQPQIFGRFANWGFTNASSTNVLVSNCRLVQNTYDVLYYRAWNMQCYDTNDPGDTTLLSVPIWGRNQITFDNCYIYGYYDLSIVRGPIEDVTFNNCKWEQALTGAFGVQNANVFLVGDACNVRVNGGRVLTYSNLNTTLVPRLFQVIGDATFGTNFYTFTVNGLSALLPTNEIPVLVSGSAKQTNFLSGSWYDETNRQMNFLSSVSISGTGIYYPTNLPKPALIPGTATEWSSNGWFYYLTTQHPNGVLISAP